MCSFAKTSEAKPKQSCILNPEAPPPPTPPHSPSPDPPTPVRL